MIKSLARTFALGLTLAQVTAFAAEPLAPTADSFLRYLEKARRAAKPPFMVNEWTRKVLHGDYIEAAHLWSAVQNGLPADFRDAATAAQLYSLWNAGLPQTFFNEWTHNLLSQSFLKSEARRVLEKTLEPSMAGFLATHSFVANPNQQKLWRDTNSLRLTVRLDARDPHRAEAKLKALAEADIAAPYELIETAALARASAHKPAEGLDLLEDNVAATLKVRNDQDLLDRFYLLKARLLFQDGALREAVESYNQVQPNSAYYPVAIEERAWSLARLGSYDRLRGDLETLTKPIFKDYFGPETFVLKAITDLKICRYADVKNDLDNFNTRYHDWAVKISQALRESATPAAPWKDSNSRLAELSLGNVRAERARLVQLEQESLMAPLTAVGKQSHWKHYQRDMDESIGEAEKQLKHEYVRIWRSRANVLAEAIRKMKFVKVELMSQLGLKITSEGTNSLPKKVATNSDSNVEVYPYEGIAWPDELFKIHSLTNTSCAGGAAR